MRPLPNIRSFLDLKEYLRAWLDHRRSRDPDYSYATFAREAELGRSTLPNTLSGHRVPTAETLDGFARAMGLDHVERRYLGFLADLDRAPTVARRLEVVARFYEAQALGQVRWGEKEQGVFGRLTSDWFVPAVLELARVPGFRATPEWVAATIMPPIDVEQAARALDILLSLGLITVEDDGSVRVHDLRIRSEWDSPLESVHHFHEQVVPRFLRRLKEIRPEERHVLAAWTVLPPEVVEEVKQLLSGTVDRFLNLGDVAAAAGQRVYQLTLQFVPLSSASPTEDQDPA